MEDRSVQSPERFAVSAVTGTADASRELYRTESEAELLRRQFGLSPRQTNLTALLLSGRSVKEAAFTLGITEGSARQYLKLIFRKTGARRQADLVRLASRSVPT
jgi:DNA-binding CsgD family transcriptional regulator